MRMSEVHADLEQARQFVAPLPLDEYRKNVSEHLGYIEGGAGTICRRVGMLSRIPGFPTMAQEEIARAKAVLTKALADVTAAEAAFVQKPRESV